MNNISQHTFLPVSFTTLSGTPYKQFRHIFGLHRRVRIFNAGSVLYPAVIHTTDGESPLITNVKFNRLYGQIYMVRNSINNPPYPKYTLILY